MKTLMQNTELTLPTISWVGCNAIIKSDYRFPQFALGASSEF
jgi:hypothetical protein